MGDGNSRSPLIGPGRRTGSWYPVASHAAVVKLVYTPSSGGGGRTPVEVRVLSAALPDLVASLRSGRFLPLSSRGLGRRPLTAETGVRIPVAVLHDARLPAGFVVHERRPDSGISRIRR